MKHFKWIQFLKSTVSLLIMYYTYATNADKLVLVKLIRKQNKDLYRICDRQQIQIAVTTLRHQLQIANISHSIQERLFVKVD